MRPYAKPLVSWPDVGSSPRALAARLPDKERMYFEGIGSGLLRPRADFNSLRREEGVPGTYDDVILRGNSNSYLDFVQ